jgi:hypothetical protein
LSPVSFPLSDDLSLSDANEDIFKPFSDDWNITKKKGLKNIINQILLLTAFGNGFTNNDFRIFTKLFIFIFRLFCQNKPNSFWYLGIAF